MRFAELSYASPQHPFLKRAMIRTVEGLSGRNRLARGYQTWRDVVVPGREKLFARLLSLANISLRVNGCWPQSHDPARPLVIVANHPFGIGDGIAVLSLAESLGRPFRVLIHSDLLRVEEMKSFALPVDFSETKEAQRRNMQMRREALALLRLGTIVVVFPAGAVATAPKVFGQAEDLPWKQFTAKLVQDAEADVLPIYFAGQNGLSFHAASRFSSTLRLSLLIREFCKLSGRTIEAYAGRIIPWNEIAAIRDRKMLTAVLRERVLEMSLLAPSKGPFKDARSRRLNPRLPLPARFRWQAPRLLRRPRA